MAEQLQVFLCAVNIAVQPEQQIGACGVRGGVALGGMRPVQNIGCSVLVGDNNIGRIEVAMSQLGVLGHCIQTGVQIVTGGRVEIGLADLADHFVLQFGQKRAVLGLHL